MRKVLTLCLIAMMLSMTACGTESVDNEISEIPGGTYKVLDVRETATDGYTVIIVLENSEKEREYFKYYTLIRSDKYVEFAKIVPGDTVNVDDDEWEVL